MSFIDIEALKAAKAERLRQDQAREYQTEAQIEDARVKLQEWAEEEAKLHLAEIKQQLEAVAGQGKLIYKLSQRPNRHHYSPPQLIMLDAVVQRELKASGLTVMVEPPIVYQVREWVLRIEW